MVHEREKACDDDDDDYSFSSSFLLDATSLGHVKEGWCRACLCSKFTPKSNPLEKMLSLFPVALLE
eukprot:scaffold10856_cov229-Amphora_coffeaeformis.AAC.28